MTTPRALDWVIPPSAAIAVGATTPNPGRAGAMAWSTTIDALVVWDGTSWQAPGGPTAGGSGDPDSVWLALSVMAIENPMNHGAAGNGTTDDTTALANTIAALPASGGIVYFPSTKIFKKTDRIVVTKAHCKLWAPNRQAEIRSIIGNTTDKQSIRSTATGFGVFGLKLTSDSTARGGSGDDHQLVADTTCSTVEWVGCEINGSRAAGLFTFGANNVYECGNYVHHTWADHIHHTETAYNIWVWENWIYNPITGGSQRGDDVVAFVTYGDDDTGNCHDAEVWDNVSIETDWGRGLAAIGVTNLYTHNNRMWGVAGAGLIIASEQGGSHATPSHNVTCTSDEISQCGHTIVHAGVLISEDNPFATNGVAITNVTLTNIKSANNGGGGDYHTEGTITGLTNTGMDNDAAHLGAQPTTSDVVIKDTSILMTRDTSHAPAGQQPGMYRIHVREHSGGFQERYEYVVKGTPTNVTAWVNSRTAAGDYLAEQQTVSGTAYALLLCATPVSLGTGVSAVSHTELRTGDNNGTLSWLWNRINNGNYV